MNPVKAGWLIIILLLSIQKSVAQSKDSITWFTQVSLQRQQADFYLKKYKINSTEGNFDDFLTGVLMSSQISHQKNYWLTIIKNRLIVDSNIVVASAAFGDSTNYQSIMMPEHILEFQEGLRVSNNTFRNQLVIDKWNINHKIDHGDYYDFEDDFEDGFFGNKFIDGVVFNRLTGQHVSVSANDFQRTSSGILYFGLTISDGRFQKLSLNGNKYIGSGDAIDLNNTIVSQTLNISGNSFGNYSETKFTYDTLSGEIFCSNSGKDQFIIFEKCYINASMNFSKEGDSKLSVLFFGCSFGPKSSIMSTGADTLLFKDCTDISSRIPLTFFKTVTNLIIVNSNIENLNFLFNKWVRVLPFGNGEDGSLRNVYEGLLTKYKRDNQWDSYQMADISYRELLLKEGNAWERTMTFISRIWWYYGYKKWLAVVWTFIFLSVFAILNYIFWKDMQIVYPFFEPESITYYQRTREKNKMVRNRLGQVLIFTTLIFFTLRINFDKLSYKKNSVLIFFFSQYLVGLLCMFYIINAVLKSG